MTKNRNIILIGMPGCGKSTVGVVLAKMLCKSFVDIDLVIQQREGRPLQALLDEHGVQKFLELEADAVESVRCTDSIIATGGSAVLTERGAKALKELGTLVYLKLPYKEIERRLGNLAERGVAMEEGDTLEALYKRRCVEYERWADVTVEPSGLRIEQTCRLVKKTLGE